MDFIYSLPLLSIHVFTVLTTLTLVVIADAHGLLWIAGKKQTLSGKRMKFLHRGVWIGLIITITAGLLMFSTYSEFLLTLPVFRLKMLFVAMLVANAVVIGKHIHIATQRPFKSISKKEKVHLIVSGLVSAIGWIGAYTAAQFLS